MSDKPAHKPLEFPNRTPEEQREWLERCFEADDGNVSVGGLYTEIANHLTLNDFVNHPLFPDQFKESFGSGDTEIWYRLNSQLLEKGLNGFPIHGLPFSSPKPPKISELSKTHVLLGKVAETHLPTVLKMMQSEWCPIEAADFSPSRIFLKRVGAEHSQMSAGDVVVVKDRGWMYDGKEFVELEH